MVTVQQKSTTALHCCSSEQGLTPAFQAFAVSLISKEATLVCRVLQTREPSHCKQDRLLEGSHAIASLHQQGLASV